MYLDDLPIWGIVGELDSSSGEDVYYILAHKKFEIGYNGLRYRKNVFPRHQILHKYH